VREGLTAVLSVKVPNPQFEGQTKGKMLNVEKQRIEKVITNDKLQPIIASIGGGFNIDKIRYHKVIIMADADVDGSHIRTLLLTFFYRYMTELIERGHVYLAMPPLYKVAYEKKTFYAYDDAEKDRILAEAGRDPEKIKIQRYKGLGEMNPDQLWETTMDPSKRNIVQIHLDDAVEAERIFSTLRGELVAPRRAFIEENALAETPGEVSPFATVRLRWSSVTPLNGQRC
jgi:DNA gyrase subunit B